MKTVMGAAILVEAWSETASGLERIEVLALPRAVEAIDDPGPMAASQAEFMCACSTSSVGNDSSTA